MSSTASEELERLAARAASEAIQFDRQGLRGMAVTKYQRATEILTKLCKLYPDTRQFKVYSEYISMYSGRIRELKGYTGYQESQGRASPLEVKAKFDRFILREKPNVKWEDIAGLEDAKKAIIESVIYPYKRPDLFPLGWPRGILLFGPPGCGKTLLAAAVATEINAAFYHIDSASIMSKWLGESEKNVSQLFETARLVAENGQPAIIFMDEIDSLFGVRTDEVGGEVRTRNQFMKEMDSVIDKNRRIPLYLIGATNKPWVLDKPFIRRFQKRILVPLPNHNSRVQLFKIYTKNLEIDLDIDLDELATETEGYSGSDIRDIAQASHMRVVSEFFESGKSENKSASPRKIGMADFLKILQIRKSSVSQGTLKFYERWFEEFKAL